MGVVLWVAIGKHPRAGWLAAAWARALRLGLVVVLGAASYFAALWLFGLRPQDFVKRGGYA